MSMLALNTVINCAWQNAEGRRILSELRYWCQAEAIPFAFSGSTISVSLTGGLSAFVHGKAYFDKFCILEFGGYQLYNDFGGAASMGLSSTWIRKDSISWIAGQHGYDYPQIDYRNLTGATARLYLVLATCGPSPTFWCKSANHCKFSKTDFLFHSCV